MRFPCPDPHVPSLRGPVRVALLALVGFLLTSVVHAGRALDPAETPSLTRIRIQQLMDTVEIYRKADGKWWVAGREVPVRAGMDVQAIRQLEALQETRPVSLHSEQDLEDHGLQVITARLVRLTFADGSTRWLRLGESAESRGLITWARDAGNPLLAETPAPAVAYRMHGVPISADINSWTSPEIISEVHLENVDTLRVSWREEAGRVHRYTLARAGDSIVLLEPGVRRAANPRKARETMGQAVSLVIDGYLEPGEMPPSRQGMPRVALHIVLRSGAVHELKAVASDTRFDYIPHPEAPDVLVKLSRARLDAFRHTPEYIATSYPYGPELDDGVSGPPPPGFAIYAPHGHRDHHDHHDHEEEGEAGDHDHEGHDHGHDGHKGHDHTHGGQGEHSR